MQPNGTDERVDTGTNSEFRAVIERYEEAPDQCTIFPVDTGSTERVSTWITAEAPGFVDLATCR